MKVILSLNAKMIAEHFRGEDRTVIECEGDADTQTVAAVLDISYQKQLHLIFLAKNKGLWL